MQFSITKDEINNDEHEMLLYIYTHAQSQLFMKSKHSDDNTYFCDSWESTAYGKDVPVRTTGPSVEQEES